MGTGYVDTALYPAGKRGVWNLTAASQTVREQQSGQHFVGVVDAVFTLPLISSVRVGTRFAFHTGVASAGTGLTVAPSGSDTILGAGIAGTAINTGATDVLGDMLEVESDGAAWRVTSVIGTWA